MDLSLDSELVSAAFLGEITATWDQVTVKEPLCYSWKSIGFRTEGDFHPNRAVSYSGGSNGNSISRHDMSISSRVTSQVSVHDSFFNPLFTYRIPSASYVFHYVNPSDRLFILTDPGEVYECFGGEILLTRRFDIPRITAAAFWPTGAVLFDQSAGDSLACYWSRDFGPPTLLCDSIPADAIGEPRAIPPEYAAECRPIVFLPTERGLRLITDSDTFLCPIGVGPIKAIEFSGDYTHLAILCEPSTLMVVSSSLSDPDPPSIDVDLANALAVAWAGPECVLVGSDEWVVAVHIATSEVIPLQTPKATGMPLLFPSGDSCVVVIDERVFYRFSLVSGELCSINYPGQPARQLIDARLEKSAAGLVGMQTVLDEAIRDCVRAATELDSIKHQQFLMCAAVFGAALARSSADIERPIRHLRVSAILRSQLNMFVIPHELAVFVSPADIVSRVAGRLQFELALAVADLLETDRRRVLTDWTALFVTKNKRSPQVRDAVLRKMGRDDFDTRVVLESLERLGQRELAVEVAAAEKTRAKTVPFYCAIGDWAAAVTAASAAFDTELLLHVVRRGTGAAFAATIAGDPVALATVSKYVGIGGVSEEFTGLIARDARFQARRAAAAFASDGNPEWLLEVIARMPIGKADRECLQAVVDHGKVGVAAVQTQAIDREAAHTPVYLVLRRCIAGKRFSDAVVAAREGGIARSRVVYLAAEIFRKDKDWNAFMGLAAEDNAECWSFLAGFAMSWGGERGEREEKMRSFVNQTGMKDKRKQSLIATLTAREDLTPEANLLEIMFNTKLTPGIFK
jgi:hypothetical protein